MSDNGRTARSAKMADIGGFMRKVLMVIFIIFAVVAIGIVVYIYVVPKFNSENRQIDNWISANNLNKYGDEANTAYSGGTPLFNEATGQRIDRYDYIKKMHSDKPWGK